MISFYKNYSGQTLSSHLGWSHYCELLSISDKDKRSFYEKECSNARWSVRELRRQIESSLYERLLLSNGKTNKEKVLELALKGNEINTPELSLNNTIIVCFEYHYLMLRQPENDKVS